MRWSAKPEYGWKPWFAFFPLRWYGDRMIWLEPIWVRWAGEYSAWCPWEMRPNEAASASGSELANSDGELGPGTN
jgi:hypothetical protein